MEKNSSFSITLSACKTPAEFKANRQNLREQSRLDSLQCYLARQERQCRKDFKTSTLKVQNHFLRRQSAQQESPCPSRLAAPSPALSVMSTNQLVSASFRRASEIPPSRGKYLSEGMFPDRLQMRRQTYGGPSLSLSDHSRHSDGNCPNGDEESDCQTCHQLARMIHSHLKEESPDSRERINDRLPGDVLTPQSAKVLTPPKDDVPFNDQRPDCSKQFMAKPDMDASSSSREGKRDKRADLPLITVDNTDSITARQGERDQNPAAGRAKAGSVRNLKHYSRLAAIAGGFSRSAPQSMTNNDPCCETVLEKKELRYSNKTAQHTPTNYDGSCDGIFREKKELSEPRKESNGQVLPDTSTHINAADTDFARRNSRVSKLQPLSTCVERKPSLTSSNLAPPNKITETSSNLESKNTATVMSASPPSPDNTMVMSSGVALPNKTSLRSASLTSPSKTRMTSSNLNIPDTFLSRLSLPNEYQTSPAQLTSSDTNNDVNFDDIIIQHAKNCPAGERESIRRNSAILDNVRKKSVPALSISPRVQNPASALHDPRKVQNSSTLLGRSGKVSSSAAIMDKSHKALHSAALLEGSRKTSNSPTVLLEGSRKTLNSPAALLDGSCHILTDFPAPFLDSCPRTSNSPTLCQNSSQIPKSLAPLHSFHRTPSSASPLQHFGATWRSDTVALGPGKAASATGSRPLQGKVSQFLQQQSEFNKRFPVQHHQVKQLDSTRPDLLKLSRGKALRGEKKKASKEKNKMMAEVLDMLGMDPSQFELDGTT